MSLNPIPTYYAGCRYRSRLEARCAVFFDHSETPFQYEWEGFNINGVRYLPDFYLPSMNSYLEVKGQWDSSLTKPRLLAEELGSDFGVYALVGGFPSERQLARTGWWDADAQTGITGMGQEFEWGSWFPLGWDPVREGCEAARSARFAPTTSRASTPLLFPAPRAPLRQPSSPRHGPGE